jgi:thiol:disulfide interchange protein DsbD
MQAATSKAAAFLAMALITLAVVAGPLDGDKQQTLRWHVDVVPTQDRDVVEVVFRADIAQGWILYSSDFSLDIGPRPAKFTFDANPAVTLLGPIEPLRSQRKKDKSLGGEYSYFAGTAEFRQKVRVIAPTKNLSGRIDGQTCFEESGVCQLFREQFAATLP